MEPEPILTAKEAASLLKVSKATVQRLVLRGVIPAIRLGPRTVRFSRQALLKHFV